MVTNGVCHFWDNSSCEGTQNCPPRCPRFFDREGEPLLIREFSSDDFTALVNMYASLGPADQTMGIPPQEEATIEQWLTTMIADGWNLLALHRDKTVVGHVAVTPASATDPEFVIFLRRGYRNRGIGTELLKQLLAHTETMDHENLLLEVSRHNQQAIHVYQNIGFDTVEQTAMAQKMAVSLREAVVEEFQEPPANR
ncbi:GNAT family N-acetyltransferase [Haloarcula sp. JP-L23]|uniref:GNAT family N-acetyltransferase n=1 Tax=Haloarcula sp. JP-L23 TaxID=2716717 RepID=UPI00140ED026|nr:GNAT family N-acetyltransferase [Haloarcula sp. JP-L23]